MKAGSNCHVTVSSGVLEGMQEFGPAKGITAFRRPGQRGFKQARH
jgi:hypothetical protein